jgi:hypothetical protein
MAAKVAETKKPFRINGKANNHMRENSSCRGRVRTSTEKLAKKQSLVVNPGRPYHW